MIAGMNCDGCARRVLRLLYTIDGVLRVRLDLDNAQAEIHMAHPIKLRALQDGLGERFRILEYASSREIAMEEPWVTL